MKTVECQGSPRDIGHATGESLRQEIRLQLQRHPGVSREAFEQRGNAKLAALRACVPHLLDEMNAMADAAGVERVDLYRANLQLWDNRLDADDDAQGCTNVVFSQSVDGPIWGKNNDGEAPGKGRPVAMRIIRPTDGIPIAAIGHAGTVPVLDGINAEGLCYGHSSVGSIFPQSDHHVDYRFWAYEGMLRCSSTKAFVQHMMRHPLSGKGFAAVVVDRSGDTLALDAALPNVYPREPESPRGTYCVNCYLRPELRNADRRPIQGKMHAFARSHYLSTLLDDESETLSVARMKALLRLREAPIICRHGETFDHFHTDCSMIGIPSRGELLYVSGAPDESEYASVCISS